MSDAATTQPPDDLAVRIGGTVEGYKEIGRFHRERIVSLLPADWSWEDKTVLDFGCGPGRTLAELAEVGGGARFIGCDIHDPSIDWAEANLPQLEFMRNAAEPPLDLPGGSVDLIYSVSVFTHLTDHWAGWLAEIHRLLRPGGVAVISFLGEALWTPFGAGRDEQWIEDETGMMSTRIHRSWDIGGPNVFHSEWWLREHWNRGFEILELRARDVWQGAEGQGWIVLRRAEGDDVYAAEFERIDVSEQRELPSLARNMRLVLREAAEHVVDSDRDKANTASTTRGSEDRAAEAEEALGVIRSSSSWKLTAPLRRARQALRDRR